MTTLDWIVLSATLLFIVIYGAWRTRGNKNIHGYLLGDKKSQWWTIGLSVMATQASAITFLSTPGQAYADGMGFVQFYFGLPLAMIIICITIIQLYHRLNVYTAYEFLEKRFDLKTRSLAAILFLIQRGLAAGITIYAPAIILSSILGWNLNLLNVIIGVLVIIYTVSGGTKAVSVTQKQQMFVIMCGMFAAFFIILESLPDHIDFSAALDLAGVSNKMNVIDFSFDTDERYTFWSGITGGLFLALSYFGTDQSQVQRYLSGKSVREMRMGLIFNGLLKVPMQFFILLVGILVFVFFQFNQAPVFFNTSVNDQINQSEFKDEFAEVNAEYTVLFEEKQAAQLNYIEAKRSDNPQAMAALERSISSLNQQEDKLRNRAKDIVTKVNEDFETNDKDYVFIHFILNYLPAGLVGLLLAVIISAAMSSTASELNALASTTTIDLYKRNSKKESTDMGMVNTSKLFTVMWGGIAIAFASFGTLFENLIQFVNIVGSIFYGTILGIFLVAFYIKWIKAKAIFLAAIISELTIIATYFFAIYLPEDELLGFLWLNAIGCALCVLLALILQSVQPDKKATTLDA
jgi:Na+/proline symporter